jgi:hypothetical protein
VSLHESEADGRLRHGLIQYLKAHAEETKLPSAIREKIRVISEEYPFLMQASDKKEFEKLSKSLAQAEIEALEIVKSWSLSFLFSRFAPGVTFIPPLTSIQLLVEQISQVFYVDSYSMQEVISVINSAINKRKRSFAMPLQFIPFMPFITLAAYVMTSSNTGIHVRRDTL